MTKRDEAEFNGIETSEPARRWEALKTRGDYTVAEIDAVDAATPGGDVEPAWWSEMMAMRRLLCDLEQLYRSAAEGDTQTVLGLIFQVFDRLLGEGCFGICDGLLQRIDLERLNSWAVIGLLNATPPAWRQLPSWPRLVARAEMRLRRLGGEEAVKWLIDKYRCELEREWLRICQLSWPLARTVIWSCGCRTCDAVYARD